MLLISFSFPKEVFTFWFWIRGRMKKPNTGSSTLESFGGDSPVLVVLNKIDENPSFELNRKFLQEKYPSIKGFFRISCKENRGVEAFVRKLKRRAFES